MIEDNDLPAIQATAVSIARQAGDRLLHLFDQPHREQTKASPYDIVTEGDRASEALVVGALREAFPTHHVVSEEGGGNSAPAEAAEYVWYVDPLDGTTNFANNIPFFAVSLGMADRHSKPLVGVVYAPVHDELFCAARGFGVTLNGRPLQVSTAGRLEKCVLGSGFPYDRSTNADNNMREWELFTLNSRGVRRFGSAALELSYVAAGRLDGFWEQQLNLWDYLAGALCVLEAGGRVSDYQGNVDAPFKGGRIVASNGLIHAEMLATLQEAHKSLVG